MISRTIEDIVEAGGGFIPLYDAGNNVQDAAIAINPTALPQHAAIGSVAVDDGIVNRHRAGEGSNSTTLGSRASRLVGVDY